MKNLFLKLAQCLGALVGMYIFSFLIYLAVMFVAAILMEKKLVGTNSILAFWASNT